MIVRYCAPTLAGLKMAALICIPRCFEPLERITQSYNQRFNNKGLFFRILCSCGKRHLFYIYWPKLVSAYISCPHVAAFMSGRGYGADLPLQDALDRLAERFNEQRDFPHELGIFLGYPLEDVLGFIRYKGKMAKCCGEWKVYGDVGKACRRFDVYNCCRRDFMRRYDNGATLDKLIIA